MICGTPYERHIWWIQYIRHFYNWKCWTYVMFPAEVNHRKGSELLMRFVQLFYIHVHFQCSLTTYLYHFEVLQLGSIHHIHCSPPLQSKPLGLVFVLQCNCDYSSHYSSSCLLLHLTHIYPPLSLAIIHYQAANPQVLSKYGLFIELLPATFPIPGNVFWKSAVQFNLEVSWQ